MTDTVNEEVFLVEHMEKELHGHEYHEINDAIKIDFEVPRTLRYLMEEAEEADLKNDGSYLDFADTIDVVSKNCYVVGAITRSQWDTIVRRYPQ